ncbi:MAG: lytic transglycosylase domain-containing protein [Desulfobacter sp.]|nr:lytic transglycosylase domain-containing protein [Desulfobacter sp.]
MIFLIRRFLYFSILVFWIAVLVFSTRLVSQAATQTSVPSSKTFPVFKEIEPNVDFWIDIFTKYSKAQGVLHDARDLSRVYKVIQLNPDNTRKAAKENQKTKKKAIKKYKAILLKLAQGHAPASAKEKKTAALFGSVPKASTLGQAALNLRIQTGLKDQFKEGLVRSGALIDEFKRIFLSHGLPQDLAFLPCVESSFNVNAYSKFSAAGIWQFTRSTGKRYMEIGYVVDQRRDPYISTQGAANLLKRNYSVLKNWPMALTAYNHGLNGMKRAKKKHQTYPRIYSDSVVSG